MAVTSARPWKLQGTSLQTLGYNIEVIDGMLGMPGKRGRNVDTPYQDGQYSFGTKFYSSRTLKLSMYVFGADVDGDITSVDGTFDHLYSNLDTLLGLLHSESLLVLSRDIPDGAGGLITRAIDVEMLHEFPITRGPAPNVWKYQALFEAPRPFWREMPKITVVESAISSFPHAFNLNTQGNAPIGDLKFTVDCTVAGSGISLSIASNDDVVGIGNLIASDSFVVDLGIKSFTKNAVRADSVISRNNAWYLRLQPAAALGMIFDAAGGTHTLTLEYYKKWL